jgi:cyanophycinase-like exopeptidase
MPSTLYLIGGGPGAILAMRRHMKAALAEVDSKKPLVAYVGVASGDNVGFRKMIGAAFTSTGARVEPVKLVAKSASVAAARSTLEDADAVFMSGGDVHEGMRVLDDRGVTPFFRELARAGKLMIGLSAGSLMLAREWIAFPDDDDAKAHLFGCIGAAAVHVDAHAEDDDWHEMRTLLTLVQRRGDPYPEGIGLTKKGCLRVHLDGDTTSLTALGTPLPRFVVRRGKVVSTKPLEL